MVTVAIGTNLLTLKHFGELVLEMAVTKTDQDGTEIMCWRLACPMTIYDFDVEDRTTIRQNNCRTNEFS